MVNEKENKICMVNKFYFICINTSVIENNNNNKKLF